MTRRSTYIPDNLNVEMAKHPEVNWSAVFQDAIRKVLSRIDDKPSDNVRQPNYLFDSIDPM